MATRIVVTALCAMLLAPPVSAHGNAGGAGHGVEMKETGFGRTGDRSKVTRTVHVEMRDTMRFHPAELTIKRGDTVRFVVKNAGSALHEMVLGSTGELQAHAALMRKHPGMEHDEPYMAHVPPGKRGNIVWQFTKAGEFQYGCLVPGHFEAGMAGRITVK
jgi:uncharacterized cupredoxin-like copper-binding protein